MTPRSLPRGLHCPPLYPGALASGTASHQSALMTAPERTKCLPASMQRFGGRPVGIFLNDIPISQMDVADPGWAHRPPGSHLASDSLQPDSGRKPVDATGRARVAPAPGWRSSDGQRTHVGPATGEVGKSPVGSTSRLTLHRRMIVRR